LKKGELYQLKKLDKDGIKTNTDGKDQIKLPKDRERNKYSTNSKRLKCLSHYRQILP
jgi:hypothetical protein